MVWTQSSHEGKAYDESITFSSSKGVNVNADIGLSFHIEPNLAPKLYSRFRLNDLDKLSDGYMHNTVREAFNDVGSKLAVQDIYGAGKSKMLGEVTQKCRDVFGKDGIIIDQLTINGTLRLPPNVSDAINLAMEATQNAMQSRYRVPQVEAEGDAGHPRQAHGAAEAARQRAQGEADALLINARAMAQANEIIRLSTTPAVLQYRAIEHWDGKLPEYNAGTLPMLTFDVGKAGAAINEATRQKRLKELLDESKPSTAPPAEPNVAAPAPSPAEAPAPAASH